MTAPAPVLTRIRVTYGKSGGLRYIGNLDMTRVWERTLRRSRLPLAYSQGYNPRPRFQVASSLPLGASSRCELLDVWLLDPPALEQITAQLRVAAPPGLDVLEVHEAPLRQPALQTLTRWSDYLLIIKIPAGEIDLEKHVAQLLATASLPRVWREKNYDLRLLIDQIALLETGEDGYPRLVVRLAAREGATGRPEEVLAALGIDPLDAAIERIALHYEDGIKNLVAPELNN